MSQPRPMYLQYFALLFHWYCQACVPSSDRSSVPLTVPPAPLAAPHPANQPLRRPFVLTPCALYSVNTMYSLCIHIGPCIHV